MRIELAIEGDVQVSREIRRVGERAIDASPAFRAILSDWIFWETEQFDSEGSTGSGGWAPLKESTIARKERAGLDPRILHATLALEKALTGPGEPSGSIRHIGPNRLVYGTTLPYAGVHQNPRTTNPLPQRRPVEFREWQREHTVKILQHWILRGVANA